VAVGQVSFALKGGFEYGMGSVTGPVCSGGANIKLPCTKPEDTDLACDSPLLAEPNRGASPTYFNQTRENGRCPHDYVLTRLYRVPSGLNAYSQCAQTIRVRDDQAPTFNVQDGTTTIECGQPIPAAPVVVATDNCDAGPIAVNYCEERTNGTCPTEYFITRTWYVVWLMSPVSMSINSARLMVPTLACYLCTGRPPMTAVTPSASLRPSLWSTPSLPP